MINPCIGLERIITIYSPDSLLFFLDLHLIGYHANQSHLFPLTTYLMLSNNTDMRQCTIDKIMRSTVSIKCDQVTLGRYKIAIMVNRTSFTSESARTSNLILLSPVLNTENGTVIININVRSIQQNGSYMLFILVILIIAAFGVLAMMKSLRCERFQSVAVRRSLENIPARRSLENIPARKSLENIPASKALENISARKSLENIPDRKSLENVSARKSSENVPVGKSSESLPGKMVKVKSSSSLGTKSQLKVFTQNLIQKIGAVQPKKSSSELSLSANLKSKSISKSNE